MNKIKVCSFYIWSYKFTSLSKNDRVNIQFQSEYRKKTPHSVTFLTVDVFTKSLQKSVYYKSPKVQFLVLQISGRKNDLDIKILLLRWCQNGMNIEYRTAWKLKKQHSSLSNAKALYEM